MNLILCGLPMSGKTTLGKRLARALQWEFIDTDRLIEETYRIKTGDAYGCRQIFLKEGEGYFRELEMELITSLKQNQSVIAIGGGALSHSQNVQFLRKLGRVIYLKTPLNLIWRRIQGNGIPPYLDPKAPERSFHALAKRRIPFYEQAAHIVIETAILDKKGVVDAIIDWKEKSDGS